MKRWRPLLWFGAVVLFEMVKRRMQKSMGPFTLQQFTVALKPVADAVEKETGIKASYGIAQAAHESRMGNSALSSPGAGLMIFPVNGTGPANNLFGFTAEVGTYWRTRSNPYVEMPTKEWDKASKSYITVRRPFRAYASWDLSYRDWARLMQTTHYAGALKALKGGTFEQFAQALLDAHYATDPKYKIALMGVGKSMGLA